eukprot:7556455-Alexandrium_andersonii.AAC.1
MLLPDPRESTSARPGASMFACLFVVLLPKQALQPTRTGQKPRATPTAQSRDALEDFLETQRGAGHVEHVRVEVPA